MSRRMRCLVSDMNGHLKLSPFALLALIPGLPEGQTQVFVDGFALPALIPGLPEGQTQVFVDGFALPALIPGLPEGQAQVFVEGFGRIVKESFEGMASSISSSAITSQPLASTGFFIQETLVVGQEKAFARLEVSYRFRVVAHWHSWHGWIWQNSDVENPLQQRNGQECLSRWSIALADCFTVSLFYKY